MARLATLIQVAILPAFLALRKPKQNHADFHGPNIDNILRLIPDKESRTVAQKVKRINVTFKVASLGKEKCWTQTVCGKTNQSCTVCHHDLLWTPVTLSSADLVDSSTKSARGNSSTSTQGLLERCTMVSNARDLLYEDAGKRIDKLGQPVLRFNGAVVKGYERHVGERTDIIVVNDFQPCFWMRTSTGPPSGVRNIFSTYRLHTNESHECIEYVLLHFPEAKFFAADFEAMSKELVKVMEYVSEFTPLLPATYNQLEPTIHGRNGEVMLSAAATDSGAPLALDGGWVTSGLLGFMVLMNACKTIHHFGFINVENCKEHYWDVKLSNKCTHDTVHSLPMEHALVALLSNRSKFPHEGTIAGKAVKSQQKKHG